MNGKTWAVRTAEFSRLPHLCTGGRREVSLAEGLRNILRLRTPFYGDAARPVLSHGQDRKLTLSEEPLRLNTEQMPAEKCDDCGVEVLVESRPIKAWCVDANPGKILHFCRRARR